VRAVKVCSEPKVSTIWPLTGQFSRSHTGANCVLHLLMQYPFGWVALFSALASMAEDRRALRIVLFDA